MLIALGAAVAVTVMLLADLVAPALLEAWSRMRAGRRPAERFLLTDPGTERRAEQRARELLRSCVNDEEWSMYRELGFIRVWSGAHGHAGDIAYLIYPHRPIVSFLVATGAPLHEYCVVFPDADEPGSGQSRRLPDSDDALAKWMALTGDETRFLEAANEHRAGRQIPLNQIRGDIWRLSRWEGSRLRARSGDGRSASGQSASPVGD
ncbi:hypothetical protein [Conexibacter sp. DBS9H8]|uniref:hypothetical protein n=1 Tax=Conexibacter sp. DBS9H8 TaxID=2937801 RepID=UPI0020100278|nr:hypothetical protein [Conexibacter sp. DBS9H8]